jgi:hypothetical protein
MDDSRDDSAMDTAQGDVGWYDPFELEPLELPRPVLERTESVRCGPDDSAQTGDRVVPVAVAPAEFKDQDPNNPDYESFGRRCETAARTLLTTPDLASIGRLRDHPLAMRATAAAHVWQSRVPIRGPAQDLWATISTSPRVADHVSRMDDVVETSDGTMYVGMKNDRRGRKRQRLAVVELGTPS